MRDAMKAVEIFDRIQNGADYTTMSWGTPVQLYYEIVKAKWDKVSWDLWYAEERRITEEQKQELDRLFEHYHNMIRALRKEFPEVIDWMHNNAAAKSN